MSKSYKKTPWSGDKKGKWKKARSFKGCAQISQAPSRRSVPRCAIQENLLFTVHMRLRVLISMGRALDVCAGREFTCAYE